MSENAAVQAVVDAADEAEPKVQTTATMADTLAYAQEWLNERNFKQVQLDRWDHPDGISIELGYAHGEVWFRGWKRQEKGSWPATKIKTTTVHPNDLSALFLLISHGLETDLEWL